MDDFENIDELTSKSINAYSELSLTDKFNDWLLKNSYASQWLAIILGLAGAMMIGMSIFSLPLI